MQTESRARHPPASSHPHFLVPLIFHSRGRQGPWWRAASRCTLPHTTQRRGRLAMTQQHAALQRMQVVAGRFAKLTHRLPPCGAWARVVARGQTRRLHASYNAAPSRMRKTALVVSCTRPHCGNTVRCLLCTCVSQANMRVAPRPYLASHAHPNQTCVTLVNLLRHARRVPQGERVVKQRTQASGPPRELVKNDHCWPSWCACVCHDARLFLRVGHRGVCVCVCHDACLFLRAHGPIS